jgi:hypothetical protein
MGSTLFDASYNNSLSTADSTITKDANVDFWVKIIEVGLKSVGDPKQRWIRFRKSLLDQGIDLFELFKLEQAFIRSIESHDHSVMKYHKVPDEVKDLVAKFASLALKQIIEEIL